MLNVVSDASDLTRLYLVAVAVDSSKPHDVGTKIFDLFVVGSAHSQCDRDQIRSLQVDLTQKLEYCNFALVPSIIQEMYICRNFLKTLLETRFLHYFSTLTPSGRYMVAVQVSV